jgi:hypothetical protein
MWTRVTSLKSVNGRRPKRDGYGVRRARTSTQTAHLIIPEGATTASHATVYSDGNGKIAFSFGDKGDFRMGGKTTRHVTIPKQLSHMIPFGTRDVALIADGGMLILDTKQFAA